MLTGKPTYEELEQRVKELEKEAADLKQVDEVFSRLASIVAFSDDAIISKTLDGIIVSWNKAAEKIFRAWRRLRSQCTQPRLSSPSLPQRPRLCRGN